MNEKDFKGNKKFTEEEKDIIIDLLSDDYYPITFKNEIYVINPKIEDKDGFPSVMTIEEVLKKK